ncbi:MAG: guanylate kinase [candidate division Zixibacteria bacterium]|nr:guanylate kinase [candidate division Zixibacteria bacterium]
MKVPKPGLMVIISSPSGGGKSSICRRLLTPSRRKMGWKFSISFTTRPKRKSERDGREYHFVSQQKFQTLAAQGMFAEHFHVHLYDYGTPREPIQRLSQTGGVMLFDVDVQGATRLHEEYPDALTIFILPPSTTELRRRLKLRGTESKSDFQIRFENARKEMCAVMQERTYPFDYVVINDKLDEAVADVLAIIRTGRLRYGRIPAEQIEKILG